MPLQGKDKEWYALILHLTSAQCRASDVSKAHKVPKGNFRVQLVCEIPKSAGNAEMSIQIACQAGGATR